MLGVDRDDRDDMASSVDGGNGWVRHDVQFSASWSRLLLRASLLARALVTAKHAISLPPCCSAGLRSAESPPVRDFIYHLFYV